MHAAYDCNIRINRLVLGNRETALNRFHWKYY